jgi:hypothetical protein
MDVKVSRKEVRNMPDGPVEVLIDNICDLYPIFGDSPLYDGQDVYAGQDKENIIMDVEILNDDRAELLDRALFALLKQRGSDPVEPEDGIQWAEALIGEVPSPVIVRQVHDAVSEEGPGVRVTPSTVRNGDNGNLVFKIELTNAM